MADVETAGIIVAAGTSTRMGFDKLWTPLGEQPVIAWSVRTFAASPLVSCLVVVTHFSSVERLRRLLGDLAIEATVVPGGALRQDSVQAGLAAAGDAEWVLVHDGARPFVTLEMIELGLAAAQATGAAITGVPVIDTIKVVEGERIVATPDRQSLWAAQTPQVFRTSLLREAYARGGGEVTDDAAMVEAMGAEVRVVPGGYGNIKITTAVDLQLANLLAQQMTAPLA